MSRLTHILHTPILSNSGITREALKWINYVVVPVFFMFAGLHQAWRTATTPFETFLGTTVAIGFALLWPVFINAVPRRDSAT